jgi:very-short-patch-repair endonuclease/ribosomal protein L37AE/L43A
MSNLIILLLLLLVVAVALALFKKKAGKGPLDFPYQSKDVLCSPAERSFLGALDKILGENYRVFAKVRLADIVDVQKGLSASVRQSAFNRISGKHIDFLVCNANDLSIFGAIELDDKTHRAKGRQKRDQFLDKTLEAAGVPLLRIKAQSAYSIKEISSSLDSVFNISEEVQPQDIQVSADVIEISDEKLDDKATDHSATQTIESLCPKCGGELVKRISTKGQYAGQKFWGCSNFPKCKFTKKAEQTSESRSGTNLDP